MGLLVWLHFTLIALRETTKNVIPLTLLCWQVWVSHVSNDEEYSLPYCDSLWSGKNL